MSASVLEHSDEAHWQHNNLVRLHLREMGSIDTSHLECSMVKQDWGGTLYLPNAAPGNWVVAPLCSIAEYRAEEGMDDSK